MALVGEALKRATTTYTQFAAHIDANETEVAASLEQLVVEGLMITLEPGRPAVEGTSYALTPRGLDMLSILTELHLWRERWNLPPLYSTATVVAHTAAVIEVSLLGAFRLRIADKLVREIPLGSQRLVIFLAIHDRAVTRGSVAGTMWPESSRERANLSLRSALSRLNAPARDVILEATGGIGLAELVEVDYHDAQELARSILGGQSTVAVDDRGSWATSVLSQDLLPDWQDPWIRAEAEDWRQLRVSALETLSALLLEHGALAEAAGAARASMKVDPLRESAHGALIAVHLAEGNQSDALRVFERYREILQEALGLDPTEHLEKLVSGLRDAR